MEPSAAEIDRLERGLKQLNSALERERAQQEFTQSRLAALEAQCKDLSEQLNRLRTAEPVVAESVPVEPVVAAAIQVESALSSTPDTQPSIAPEPVSQAAEPQAFASGRTADGVRTFVGKRSAAYVESLAHDEEPIGQATRSQTTASQDLETTIGLYWFSRLGAISLLVGFVLLASLIQPHLTPGLRTLISYVAAGALFALGAYYEKRSPKFAAPLQASGLVLAFFTSFAAHFIPPMHCLSLTSATVLMMLAASAVMFMAWQRKSEAFGLLSQGMAFWVAFFSTALTQSFTPMLLFVLCGQGILFLLWLGQPILWATAVAGVYCCNAWWMLLGTNNWSVENRFVIHLIFLISYFIAFAVGDALFRLATRGEKAERAAGEGLVSLARLANPMALFILGTVVFFTTQIHWQQIHLFYWPLGVAMLGIVFVQRAAGVKLMLVDDVWCALGSGIVALGFVSRFDGMTLGNIIAFEGFCLIMLRVATGRRIFTWLSVALQAAVLFYSGLRMAPGWTIAEGNNWHALWHGLPAVAFTLAPALLVPWWSQKQARAAGMAVDESSRLELSWEHARAVLGSLLLLQLFISSTHAHSAFPIWVLLLLPGALGLMLAFPAIQPARTLALTVLVWCQGYMLVLGPSLAGGEHAWLLPSAVCLALITLAGAIYIELSTRTNLADLRMIAALEQTHIVIIALAALAAGDFGYIVIQWLSPQLHLPVGALLALAVAALCFVRSIRSAQIAGLLIMLIVSGEALLALLGRREIDNAYFAYTCIGVALLILYERFAAWLARDGWLGPDNLMTMQIVLLAFICVIPAALFHHTPWLYPRFVSVALMALAVGLFCLGLACRSPLHRRFGLGLLVLVLVRIYLIDLAHLGRRYKIVAFMALGCVLIGISWLYAHKREKIMKWM